MLKRIKEIDMVANNSSYLRANKEPNEPFKVYSLDADQTIILPDRAYDLLVASVITKPGVMKPGVSILRRPAPMFLFLSDGVMIVAAGMHENRGVFTCWTTIDDVNIPDDLRQWWNKYKDKNYTLSDAHQWVTKMVSVFCMAFEYAIRPVS
jgi:hypothetical protein